MHSATAPADRNREICLIADEADLTQHSAILVVYQIDIF